MNDLNLLVVGVGGQGTILAGDVLAEIGMLADMDSKKSDILGLAIRSGSVVSHIRWGKKIQAPMCMKGTVDFILGFEPLESLRVLDYLKKDGTVIVNDYVIPTIGTTTGKEEYPTKETIIETLNTSAKDVYIFDATKIAEEVGSTKIVNVLLIGALSSLIDIDISIWEKAIRKFAPPKFQDLNISAFQKGRSLMEDY